MDAEDVIIEKIDQPKRKIKVFTDRFSRRRSRRIQDNRSVHKKSNRMTNLTIIFVIVCLYLVDCYLYIFIMSTSSTALYLNILGDNSSCHVQTVTGMYLEWLCGKASLYLIDCYSHNFIISTKLIPKANEC